MKKLGLFIFLFCVENLFGDSIVAYWDFGPDPDGYTEVVSIENANGTPSLTGMSAGTGYDTNGQTGVAFVDIDGTSHDAGQALAWGSGVNDGDQEWIFQVDLTGYQGFDIRWDHRSSTVYGPTNVVFEYKVGSGSWNLLETISLTQDATFHSYEKDLSTVTAINNQSEVYFRLSNFGGGSGNGTYRMDNLELTTVPEPMALSLIGAVLGGTLFLRRIFII